MGEGWVTRQFILENAGNARGNALVTRGNAWLFLKITFWKPVKYKNMLKYLSFLRFSKIFLHFDVTCPKIISNSMGTFWSKLRQSLKNNFLRQSCAKYICSSLKSHFSTSAPSFNVEKLLGMRQRGSPMIGKTKKQHCFVFAQISHEERPPLHTPHRSRRS